MVVHRTLLTQLLDEIERLRGIIGREHADRCTLMRTGSACSCGCVTEAAETLLENTNLRATVQCQERIIAHHLRTIANLDLRVAEARAYAA